MSDLDTPTIIRTMKKDNPPILADPKDDSEEMNRLMMEGYDRIDQRDETGACEIWLQLWDILKSKVTPGIKSIEEAEALFDGDEYLSNWVHDLDTGLANAALDNPLFHEQRLVYCREFIQLFPASVDIIKHMKLAIADSLFQLGKKAEAEQEYQRMVAEDPAYPWGYIHWGDCYAGEDNAKAEALYRKALGMDKAEDKVIRERLQDLKDMSR